MNVGQFLKKDKGKWHKIPRTKVRVRIKPLKYRQRLQLAAAYSNENGAGMEKLADIILRDCISEWEDIDADGAEFPCTYENKCILFDNWPAFAEVCTNIVLEEITAAQKKEETEEKNS